MIELDYYFAKGDLEERYFRAFRMLGYPFKAVEECLLQYTAELTLKYSNNGAELVDVQLWLEHYLTALKNDAQILEALIK